MNVALVPTKTLFEVAREEGAIATESTLEKIKTLIEEGDVPEPGVRYAFQEEINPDLAQSLWKTLKQKSENPLKFVSVIKECWVTGKSSCGFTREAVKEQPVGNRFKISEIVLTDEKRMTVLFIETTEGRDFLVTNEVLRQEGKCYLKGVYVYHWAKPQSEFETEMKDMSEKIISHAQEILKAN